MSRQPQLPRFGPEGQPIETSHLEQAMSKVDTEKQRADAAIAEVERQKGFVAELTAVNQRNVRLMESFQARLTAQQMEANAVQDKLGKLNKSYAAAIRELKDAKQQSAPISDNAGRGV